MYLIIITILIIILFIVLLIIINNISKHKFIESDIRINAEGFGGGGHGGGGFSGGSMRNRERAGFSGENIGKGVFDRGHNRNHHDGRHQGWGYYGNGGRSLWNGYYGVSPIYNNYSYWDDEYYPEPIYVDQPVIVKEVPVYINNNES
jgi:hypothetical protein